MPLIYNGGTYDLLHPGHLRMLRKCRELAGPDGQVVVALNTDEFVAQFKGHSTVQPYLERSEVLSALRFVDRVIPNVGGSDSRPAIEAVGPDIIAVGRDWYSPDHSKYCAQMGFTTDWLAERNIALAYIDWSPGYSSTNIRGRVLQVAVA